MNEWTDGLIKWIDRWILRKGNYVILIIYSFFIAPEEVINLISINPIAPNITITWTPPSIRNGLFNYNLSYEARQDFTYTFRIQTTSETVELPFGTTSYVITNVLPFANYTITVVAFNRQFGRMFSSDNVVNHIRTQPIGKL